jgi:uncharacterized protein DUF4412
MRIPTATTLVATLTAASALPAQTAPRFEGVVRYATVVEGTSVEMVYVARGSKVRTEMHSPRFNMVMISDPDAGEVIMVDDKSRTYTVIKAGGDDEENRPTVFTRTGTRDRVLGYDCVYYHIEMSDGTKADVCAAAGMGVLMGGKDSWVPRSTTAQALAAKYPDLARTLREGFVPLKWKAWIPDEQPMTLTATSIERKLVDPSQVQVPAGYKKIELPADMPRRRP